VPAIRMLLVGDNVDFVEGLRDWLVREPDIEIVGIEHTAQAAIDRVAVDRPQIVLMDVTMPEVNGFEGCRRLRGEIGSPTIILMSFHESETVRREAWAAGADGVVGKGHIAKTLLPMVRDLAGESTETKESRRRTRAKEDDSWA
jgi:DNA-binding NarL/FixJ family response regulator